ncbi:DUF1254 domain-containing protein [Williamsia muralis]|uniref:DUF1254 domain-containing protein n=1 Tax=Williamsia marianensis TaxID=85044 RepID=UPI00380A16FB
MSEEGSGRGRAGFARYHPMRADQLSSSTAKDVVPLGDKSKAALASSLMQLAVMYGLPSVYQYASMCAACAPEGGRGAWRLNLLNHERDIAGAGYQPFRVPNVDTLYSNAWIDLTDGPVVLELPRFDGRYYTLNFLDAYSNASNISHRTHPNTPRRVLVATTDWEGLPPHGAEVFRVATPMMWLLMRIQVFGQADLPVVHELQDSVTISGASEESRTWPVVSQHEVESAWKPFLVALDASLRINGAPVEDYSLASQFRLLGVGGQSGCDPETLDPAVAEGALDGFASAMTMIEQSRPLLGRRLPVGWTRVLDKGAHGTNFLARAVMNFVGLGANVVEENCSYNTYVDSAGGALDGSIGVYRIEVTEPPPAKAFWSITLYEADSGWLYDAPEHKHSVGSATGHGGADRLLSRAIYISRQRPPAGTHEDWLPSPAGKFFLVLRIYQPREEALSEAWTPPPVRPVADRPVAT